MAEVAQGVLTVGLSAAVGYGGKIAQDWWAASRASRAKVQELRAYQAREYFFPLLQAAREFRGRLAELTTVYTEGGLAAFTSTSLSRDFRELYLLAPDEIGDLFASDPDEPRRDTRAAQRLRKRMCYELNFATSSLYRTARYLAVAGRVQEAASGGHLDLPEDARAALQGRLADVRSALQGATGAGLFVEQQESIGELMRDADGRASTNAEFRHRLLEVPGWEQFAALLIFFISEDDRLDAADARARLSAKMPFEVRETIAALTRLETVLASLPNTPPADHTRPVAARSDTVPA
jgi:hypothetical protein